MERGDVIVFVSEEQPDRHLVKRVVALAGDTVALRDGQLILNGAAVARGPITQCSSLELPSLPPGDCEVSEETLGSHHYRVIQYPDAGLRHFPDATTRCPQGTEPAEAGCRIADGHLFVLGDNRDNSSDSRFWGAVPFSHLKGVATSVHFSLSPEGDVRWPRIGWRIP